MIIVAIVSRYITDNVLTDYDDGSFESFDTTQLRVVEPVEIAGRLINIHHNTPQPTGSPWRSAGTRLRLEFEKETIESLTSGDTDIFSDGARILQS
ncbi:MAG TPA: hypothetical protein VKM55_19730 [Candidatus Lokiarchaeia archaeon]|nr:hypothetical protein [Candidatus Lokiarchaeia archaeon]